MSTEKIILTALILRREYYSSVIELRKVIYDSQNTNMDVRTIVKGMDKLKQLGHRIAEATERRGKFNLPVKVFRLEKFITPQPQEEKN